jgi:hypothetical protein
MDTRCRRALPSLLFQVVTLLAFWTRRHVWRASVVTVFLALEQHGVHRLYFLPRDQSRVRIFVYCAHIPSLKIAHSPAARNFRRNGQEDELPRRESILFHNVKQSVALFYTQ